MLMTGFSSRVLSIVFSISASFTPALLPPALADTIEPPPGSGSPSGTIGGASRPIQPACRPTQASTQKSLIALAPGQKVGVTAARPKFTVYLPRTIAKVVEISLFDAQMRGVYQTTIAMPEQTGLVNLELPDTAPELEVGKPYFWTVALICNEQDRTEDWVVGGWVQRSQLTPTLSEKLERNTTLDQSSLYAQAGFWYDAVAASAETQKAYSFELSTREIATTWNPLLESAELDTLMTTNLTH